MAPEEEDLMVAQDLLPEPEAQAQFALSGPATQDNSRLLT
jgi:hypothetical protein